MLSSFEITITSSTVRVIWSSCFQDSGVCNSVSVYTVTDLRSSGRSKVNVRFEIIYLHVSKVTYGTI